jgi:predicted acylesterase/phospholipase RssA/CRP-like cAMP-binding protein
MIDPEVSTAYPDVSEALSATIFGGLDPPSRRAIAPDFAWRPLLGGETLFREHDPGSALYLLIYGRLRVLRLSEGREVEVGEVGRGESVGEIAVITGEPRSATVQAIRDSLLLELSGENFQQLIERYPRAMFEIARIIVERTRQVRRPRRGVKTIAVVPATEEAAALGFGRKLAEVLGAAGSTLYLDRSVYEGIRGRNAAALATSGRPGAWLNEQEDRYSYIIGETESELNWWTERCVRQADRILIVGCADSPPEPGAVERGLRELGEERSLASTELVLVHRKSESITGTREWLCRRAVDRHHHVRLERSADLARVARLLTGRAVGVVLGGGGARGFAHIGLLRALEEARIPVDAIGGTSIGAMIAAQYARGLDYRAMLEVNRRGWIEGRPMADKTLPIIAMLAGRNLDRMIHMMFENVQIEDLSLRYFCLSSNLSRARVEVHQEGSLSRWVRASLAIPGVASPVFDHGDLLVDGGVLNNLPADVMAGICRGEVIAADVSSERDLGVDPRLLHAPTGWQMLWNRINPLAENMRVPTVIDIMMRTTMLSSIGNTRQVRERADLYVHSPLAEFGVFEWSSLERIAEAGYHTAQKLLAEWRPAGTGNEEVR